jgi:hypothetical protein
MFRTYHHNQEVERIYVNQVNQIGQITRIQEKLDTTCKQNAS